MPAVFGALAKTCLAMAKNDKEHKREVLLLLHRCSMLKLGKDPKNRNEIQTQLVLAWILRWLQPILKMLHKIILRESVIN
jgi:hypothetical protein